MHGSLVGIGAGGLVLIGVLLGAFPASSKPASSPSLFTMVGKASYYGPGFHGRKTASGEIFDMNELVAAHRTLPLGTVARVTNLANGRSVVVRINDRGPYIRGRILDLSKAAAHALKFVSDGLTRVRIEVLQWGDLDTYPEGGPVRPV